MSSYDDQGIVTPEAVVLQYEPARLPSRLLAFFIDLVVLSMILTVGWIFFLLAMALAVSLGLSETVVQVAALLLGFVSTFGYPIAVEVLMKGRSPGKAAVGLRTVTIEGLPIRARHSMIRTLLLFVDYPLTSGVGAVMSILLSKNGQRLGDMVAGTVVRRERASAPYVRSMRFNPPQGYDPYINLLDTTMLTPADELAVRTFVLRAAKLRSQVRTTLAYDLAPLIAGRLAHTPPPNVPPDLFLASVAVASQRRVGVPDFTPNNPWAGQHPPSQAAPQPPVEPTALELQHPSDDTGAGPDDFANPS